MQIWAHVKIVKLAENIQVFGFFFSLSSLAKKNYGLKFFTDRKVSNNFNHDNLMGKIF